MSIRDIQGMETVMGTFYRPVPVVAAAVAGGGLLAGAATALTRGTSVPIIVRAALAVAGGLAGAAAGGLIANRLVSHAPPQAAAGEHELRVMTVNIHMGVPKGVSLGDEHETVSTFADVSRYIRETNADVIFVQEVDDDIAGADGVPRQLRLLGEMMGATDYEYAAREEPESQNRYGVATYVRNGIELENPEVVTLPYSPGFEARRMLSATAVLPDGNELTVVNTHLDHSGVDRPRQLDELSHQLSTIDGPLIVGGDFNTTLDVADPVMARSGLSNVLSSDVVTALPAGMHDSVAAPTYLTRRIDHLYSSADVNVSTTWTQEIPMHDVWWGFAVSDHRPVVADFVIDEH